MSVLTCTCPSCRITLKTEVVPPGKAIKCPKCANVFIVPEVMGSTPKTQGSTPMPGGAGITLPPRPAPPPGQRTLTCTHCQAPIRLTKPKAPGTPIKCPKCAQSFPVPAEDPNDVVIKTAPPPAPKASEVAALGKSAHGTAKPAEIAAISKSVHGTTKPADIAALSKSAHGTAKPGEIAPIAKSAHGTTKPGESSPPSKSSQGNVKISDLPAPSKSGHGTVKVSDLATPSKSGHGNVKIADLAALSKSATVLLPSAAAQAPVPPTSAEDSAPFVAEPEPFALDSNRPLSEPSVVLDDLRVPESASIEETPAPVEKKRPGSKHQVEGEEPAEPAAQKKAESSTKTKALRKRKNLITMGIIGGAIAASLLVGGLIVVLTSGTKHPPVASQPGDSDALAKAAAWREFSPQGARCKIQMPGNPERQAVQADGKRALDHQLFQSRLKAENVFLDIGWLDLAPGITDVTPFDKLYSIKRDQAIASTSGKIMKETPLTLSGYPGQEYLVETNTGALMIERLYLVHNRLYILTALGPRLALIKGTGAKFFDSFALAESARPGSSIVSPFANIRQQGGEVRPVDKTGKELEVDLRGVKNINTLVVQLLPTLSVVPGLHLRCSGLTDATLPKIAELTNLVELDINDAKISDAGLMHLKKLTKLRKLRLEGARLSDAGLAYLRELTALEQLSLGTAGDCNFTNDGLKNLKDLVNLRSLSLRSKTLTDSGLANFAGMTKMERLSVNPGLLTDVGLGHIKGMTKLKSLFLESDQLTDVGLAHLKNFTEMTDLYLDLKTMTDAGLANIAGMTKLEELNLRNATKLTSAALVPFKGLSSLRKLSIVGCGRIGLGSSNLGSLPKLQFLWLDHDGVDESIKGLQPSTSIEVLALTGTGVTDNGLAQMTGLKNLKSLDLSRTRISDKGLPSLGALANLTTLNLSETKVTDAGLLYLKGLAKLETLDLTKTGVADEGLANLKALANLKDLTLTETKITDEGLAALKGVPALEHLKIGDNGKITDAAVNELKAMKKLTTVSLGKTSMTDDGKNRLKKAMPKLTLED